MQFGLKFVCKSVRTRFFPPPMLVLKDCPRVGCQNKAGCGDWLVGYHRPPSRNCQLPSLKCPTAIGQPPAAFNRMAVSDGVSVYFQTDVYPDRSSAFHEFYRPLVALGPPFYCNGLLGPAAMEHSTVSSCVKGGH